MQFNRGLIEPSASITKLYGKDKPKPSSFDDHNSRIDSVQVPKDIKAPMPAVLTGSQFARSKTNFQSNLAKVRIAAAPTCTQFYALRQKGKGSP